MTAIAGQRIILQQEETDYKSAVSEALLTRVGATTNFIATRQYDTKDFVLNGLYSKGVGTAGKDAIISFPYDTELIGMTMFNRKNGTGGTTTLDLRRFTASGGSGTSIFTTKPAMNTNVGANAWLTYLVEGNNTVIAPALGSTSPFFLTTLINAGDIIQLVIDSAMTGAEDCILQLYHRPR